MSDLTREARTLVESASDGPWSLDVGCEVEDWPTRSIVVENAHGGMVVMGDLQRAHDAALIARAPTLLAEMADRMERLEAVVRAVPSLMDEADWLGWWDDLDAALGLAAGSTFTETRRALGALLGDE